MHNKTEALMSRIRERTDEMEEKLEARIDTIMKRSGPRDEEPAPASPEWIDSDLTATDSDSKGSILDLLRGDVEPKSSNKRNPKL